MSAPRVLFITGEYPPMRGGIADYTAHLRAALVEVGIESLVLSAAGASGDGVQTVTCWDRSALSAVCAALDKPPIDLVHIQYQAGAFDMQPAINLLPWRITRQLRLPVVTTFHDLRPPYLFPKAGPLRQWLLRRMARASRAVIVTNPADGRVLTATHIPTTRIPIGPNLPLPTSTTHVQPRTVAYFGFPARSKGILELIAALGMLDADWRPSLVVIGESGQPSSNNDLLAPALLDAAAAAAGITLTRTGYLDPLAASAALARAAVIALPFRDGASLRSGSLLAALQAGRPVVTTAPAHADDLGALAALPQLALVTRAGAGAGALADAIRAAQEGGVAPAPLPAEFQWDAIAERHAELYASVLPR